MDIERVRRAASAHYEGLAGDQKQMARRLFEAMDTDNSGNISIDEFVAFLSCVRFQSDNNYWLFAQLDVDNNGTLDFNELLTFFYVFNHDEYKNLLNSQPSTVLARCKAKFARWTRRFNNQGRCTNWREIINLFGSVIQIVQFLTQILGCPLPSLC